MIILSDMDSVGYFLLGTAFVSAIVHSLIPEHWLPIVLVAKSEGWKLKKVVFVEFLAGLFHIIISAAIGVLIFYVGEKTAISLAVKIETLSHILLVVFGAGYIIYDFTFGHGHLIRSLPHHKSEAHYPARAKTDRYGTMSTLILAAVVGFHPCVLVVSLIVASLSYPMPFLWVWTLVVFSSATMGGLILASVVGYKSIERLHYKWLERYGGLISGLLIALLGVILIVK